MVYANLASSERIAVAFICLIFMAIVGRVSYKKVSDLGVEPLGMTPQIFAYVMTGFATIICVLVIYVLNLLGLYPD
jgi:hypothetical protein